MIETNSKCLFCGQDCRRDDSQVFGEYYFHCDNCKQYFTADRLEKDIAQFSSEDKEKISTYLKNRDKIDFKKVYTVETLKEIIQNA